MSPLGVGISHSDLTLQSGESKLWILLVGVNEYQDRGLPSLRYPALDCQGLGDALAKATEGFPNKEVMVHNDFAPQAPLLQTVRSSIQRLVTQARSQDTIMLYFSGHGMLEQNTEEAFLCLQDTNKNKLRTTGLGLQDLLEMLGSSRACQQLICLDTCHSGDMMLRGNSRNPAPRDAHVASALNTTTQFMQVLRERASQSKGFCALLSCDQGQQSWEFPELGHGVFTYYLMRGLLGEAADERGLIEVDGLYKYVYRQTLQYIHNLNQQVRLINQQKRDRGDSQLHPEYPQQTPKRIVEGVGELILGYRSAVAKFEPQRQALIINGLVNNEASAKIATILHGAGGFRTESFPESGKNWSEVRAAIQKSLRWQGQPAISNSSCLVKDVPTNLLYLRGRIEEIEDGEAWLVLEDGVRLSRSWLRQELRRCSNAQQIMILDCPGATSLEDWLEDLRLGSQQGQCLIAAASPPENPDLFAKVVFDTLATANPHKELPIAGWIHQLQKPLAEHGIDLHTWISGCQSVIDVLPGNISQIGSNQHSIKVEPERRKPEIRLDPGATKINFCTVPPSSDNFDLHHVHNNSSFLPSNSEAYKQLQQILMQLAGPIAPTLLKKVLAKSATPSELVNRLASHLLPNQQENFQRQAMGILEPAIPRMKTPPPELLDVGFANKCERELIDLIGPMGTYLIEAITRSHPQILPTELVRKLADEIPDPKVAWEFKRRFHK